MHFYQHLFNSPLKLPLILKFAGPDFFIFYTSSHDYQVQLPI
jgi:hypothetical protein